MECLHKVNRVAHFYYMALYIFLSIFLTIVWGSHSAILIECGLSHFFF